jgi:PPK2 family polyphosphate:nucleotide phosphotransferase
MAGDRAGRALRAGLLVGAAGVPGHGRSRQGRDDQARHVWRQSAGCDVFSFKQPSHEELSHDFLWRYLAKVPQRGRIGIFNRSYYEDVLVVRVHRHPLEAQKIPPALITDKIWDERLADIARFEDYLTRQGVIILKFYLNLSYEEQKRRFLKRLDKPDKSWKFSPSDVRERRHWDEYMQAYEAAIRATSTEAAPWYVVPADKKWFTRLVVAAAVVEAVEKLNPSTPRYRLTRRRRWRRRVRNSKGKRRRRSRQGSESRRDIR